MRPLWTYDLSKNVLASCALLAAARSSERRGIAKALCLALRLLVARRVRAPRRDDAEVTYVVHGEAEVSEQDIDWAVQQVKELGALQGYGLQSESWQAGVPAHREATPRVSRSQPVQTHRQRGVVDPQSAH